VSAPGASGRGAGLRPWHWQPRLSSEGRHLPVFLQIARSIIGDIRDGRLKPGDPLPGSRTLAHSLGVHRNTVLAGYRELAAEGWVRTELAGGTFVAEVLPRREPPGRRRPASFPRGPGYAVASPAPYEPVLSFPPGTLVLAKGTPDVRLLPTVELARAYRRAVLRHGRELLAYGDPRGHPRLRAALASMLSSARGITVSPDCVFVARGSQMGLTLLARALLEPGDGVAVEALGHPNVWSALRLAGGRLLPVAMDDGGLSVDALEALADREAIRAVYVTPHHQFPTTTVMPAHRRQALIDFAVRRRIAIIEDDYDHEFHYSGRPVLPLASHDPEGVVLYVGTLSKILAPGLRIGFVVAPPAVIERMLSLRVATDIQGDLAVECAVAALFESGELGRHVRRMRRAYHARRDALVEALARELPGALSFNVPSGGMALWAAVAPGLDVEAWARAAGSLGVGFRGARLYGLDGGYLPFTRLGFTGHDEQELAEAARRMATALAQTR